MFSLFATATDAGATDISSVVVCSYLSEASSVICKDPSHSDSVSISFVLLELVLVPRSYCYTCFVFRQITLSCFICRFCPTIPLLQGELVNTLPNVTTLS